MAICRRYKSERKDVLATDSKALDQDQYNTSLALARGERAVLSSFSEAVTSKGLPDIDKLKQLIPSKANEIQRLDKLPEKMRVIMTKKIVEDATRPIIMTIADKMKNTLFDGNELFTAALDKKVANYKYEDLYEWTNIVSGGTPLDKRWTITQYLSTGVSGGNAIATYYWLDKKGFMSALNDRVLLSDLIGKDIPEESFDVYKELVKQMAYIGDDGLFMKALGLVTSPRRYRAGQTLLNPAQVPVLLALNSITLLPEELVRYKGSVAGDVDGFMDEFGVLQKQSELLQGEVKGKDVGFVGSMKKIAIGTSTAIKTGWYNATELVVEKEFTKANFLAAMKELHPEYTDIDEFARAIRGMSDSDRVKTIDDIQKLTKAKAMVVFDRANKVFSGDKLGGAAKLANRAFGFMGSWGRSVQRHVMQVLTEGIPSLGRTFSGTVGQKYIDILTTEGYSAAKKFIQKTYNNNLDVGILLQKVFLAGQMGVLFERYYRQGDYDDTTEDRLAQLNVGDLTLFSAQVQSFMSTPWSRIGLSIMDGLYNGGFDEKYYRDSNDKERFMLSLEMGGLGGITSIAKELGRRFPHIKAVARATGGYLKDADAVSFWSELWKGYNDATSGMQRFASTEITKNEFHKDIPLTSRSRLMNILGTPDEYIQMFRENSKFDQMQRALQDSKGFLSYLSYQIPILGDYKGGKFIPANNAINKFQDALVGDKTREELLGGEIDFSKMPAGMGLHGYSILTQFNPSKSHKSEEGRFDDMRKQFTYKDKKTGETKSIFNLQEKEDVFVKEAMDALGNGDREKFLNVFRKQDPEGKGIVQLIAFLNTSKPGSGREFLSNYVNDEYWRILKNNKLYNLYKTNPELNDKIKSALGQKFLPLLFVADKQSRVSGPMMYYARESKPELKDVITDPFKSGFGQEMSIATNEKGEGGEVEKKRNSRAMALFTAETLANIAVATGDPQGKMLNSAMGGILASRFSSDEEGQARNNKTTLIVTNNILSSIKNSHLPNTSKAYMQASVITHMLPSISLLQNDSEVRNKLGDVWDVTMGFIFGTAKDVADAQETLGQFHYYDDKFKMGSDPKSSTSEYGYYNTGGSGHSYRASSDRKSSSSQYSGMYNKFNTAIKLFKNTSSPVNDYQPITTYNYSKKLRDYVTATARARDSLVGKMMRKNVEPAIKQQQPKVGRSYSASKGFAKPAGKKPDINKQLSTDWNKRTFTRRRRKTKLVQEGTRKHLTKG